MSLLLLLVAQIYVVQANIECSLKSYSWAYNANNVSPCDVAWALIKECDSALGDMSPLPNWPDRDGFYNITSMMHTKCLCNTITYSLISACSQCQGQSYSYWSDWTYECGGQGILYQYSEPIPPGLDVPAWAYMDVTTVDYFNASAAFRNASATRLLAAGDSSTSVVQSQSFATPAPLPPTNSTSNTPIYNITNTNVNNVTMPDSSKGDSSKIDIPTLIGAITGSISGLVVLTLAVLKYRDFRRNQARKAQMSDTEKYELVGKADDEEEDDLDIELDSEHGAAIVKHAKTEH